MRRQDGAAVPLRALAHMGVAAGLNDGQLLQAERFAAELVDGT